MVLCINYTYTFCSFQIIQNCAAFGSCSHVFSLNIYLSYLQHFRHQHTHHFFSSLVQSLKFYFPPLGLYLDLHYDFPDLHETYISVANVMSVLLHKSTYQSYITIGRIG